MTYIFTMNDYTYQDIRRLTEDLIGKPIWIQGRLHKLTNKKHMLFVFIRYQTHMLQAIAMKKEVDETEYKLLIDPPSESIINLFGILKKSPFEINSATYKTMELVFININWNHPLKHCHFK